MTWADFKNQLCLVSFRLLLWISGGSCSCCSCHRFDRDCSKESTEWLKQTEWSGDLNASLFPYPNFNLSLEPYVWDQQAIWWNQLCYNCYEEIVYGICSPVSWKRTRNHLQGISVQTQKWLTLGQAYPIVICGILGESSAPHQLPGWNGLVLPGPQEETKQMSWVLFAPKDRRVRASGYREKLHVLYHWSSGGEIISHSTPI